MKKLERRYYDLMWTSPLGFLQLVGMIASGDYELVNGELWEKEVTPHPSND